MFRRIAPRRRLSPLALWLVALLPLTGCSAFPEFDWNPLIRVEKTADGATEVEALGPFIDIRSGLDGVSHALRPLYQHRANSGWYQTDFLAPFGRRWRVHDGRRWRLWPLIWSGRAWEDDAGSRWQLVVFPLIYAGGGSARDSGYFAFFPIGGRTRDAFGIEQFDFFLWPLFMRTHMRVTEPSTSWTVLLLGGWTTGGPRDGSWRLLPFYRRRLVRDPEGRMRTDQRSVLWPFFTWGRDYMDEPSPSYRFAFWPLFSTERSSTWSKSTWIWPFFRVNNQIQPKVSEGGAFLYDLPWPFFRWARDKDRYQFRIWPFYARNVTEDLDSRAFLIPFGWWRHTRGFTINAGDEAKRFTRRDLWVVPFWHSGYREVEARDGRDTWMHLWPVFHKDNDVDGATSAAFPSISPFRRADFWKPMDELYSPFFTLWRRRTSPEADETRLLLDTFIWRYEPEGLRVSIPFLYSRRPQRDGTTRHGLLWGLFGTRTDTEGLDAVTLAGFDVWSR